MPEPKRPLKVFLCHAHADRDPVRGLYARLTQDGVDAWLDKAKLLPGQDWELEIRKAVREADVVVVCLSKQFNQAGFRQKEVRLALDTAMEKPEGEIFIIPARLDECDNLESLRKWHWVNLFEADGYEMLMRAFRARANRIGATLQVKRSWLPKIISPRSELKKSIQNKKIEEPNGNIVETKKDNLNNLHPLPDDMAPSPDNFPDGWEAQWQSGFVKTSKDEKVKLAIPEKETTEAVGTTVEKPREKRKRLVRRPNTAIVVAIIGFAGIVIIGLLSSPLIEKWFSIAPVVTESVTATYTLTSQSVVPSQTLEPTQIDGTPTITLTPTGSFTPAVISLPTEIIDTIGVEMVLVPAGEFTMGIDVSKACPNATLSAWWACEKTYDENAPLQMIFLDTFYIDKYEVTNAKYQECVSTGQCKPPAEIKLGDINYYGNSNYDSYPVVWITWEMAKQYCTSRDAYLPSNAEWEKAARGTDQRIFPWGNHTDVTLRTNGPGTKDGFQVTAPVGSFPLDVSPYGAFDMAGNVSEMVIDKVIYFHYFGNADSGNTFTPYTYSMTKGGNWSYSSLFVYDFGGGSGGDSSVGFRCARDANP